MKDMERGLVITIDRDVAAGTSVNIPVALPYGGQVVRMHVTLPNAQAASGSAANEVRVELRDPAGTALGTITNLTSVTNNYNPARLSTAYTANTPVTLNFERRPGIDYALATQQTPPNLALHRAEVQKIVDFNRPVRINGANNTTGSVFISKGASATAGAVTVTLEVREG